MAFRNPLRVLPAAEAPMNVVIYPPSSLLDMPLVNDALVIDADPQHLEGVMQALAMRMQVTGLGQGGEALEALQTRSWGMVFIDLDLTDITGMQVIDRLAESGDRTGLVIMSSQPSRLLHAAAGHAIGRGLNVVAAVRKPMRVEFIGDMLDELEMMHVRQSRRSRVVTMPLQFSAHELRMALEWKQIRPYFQPQHDVMSGRLRGAEMLARWHHPDGRVLAPVAFLPAFEQEGMVAGLTSYMLHHAFELLAGDERDSHRVLAVNVPATVASSIRWAQDVSEQAAVAGVDPGRMIIEITEDGGPGCDLALSGVVTQLRLRGFRCAIDDFGSGDSSLDRLRAVPFNEIKINRSMVLQAREHMHARSLLASTIAMGRQLVATVVAEGIEEQSDLRMVRELGCHVSQGYLHGRAMSRGAYVRYAQHCDL